jgi:regulator of RNase E activity RraA
VTDLDGVTARLIHQLQELYTPAVSDALDALGMRSQVLSPDIRPLKPSFRFVGRALTGRAERYPEYTAKPLAAWARMFVKMLDAAVPGDVFVVSAQHVPNIATWGELMSTAARARGAVGAVTDGAVRDTPKILAMRPPFPVFGRNYTPCDAKGRLEFTDFNQPITCAGVGVRPGDLVFGDLDGVVVIPGDEAERVVAMARERAGRERVMRQALHGGERMGIAFRRYRTL